MFYLKAVLSFYYFFFFLECITNYLSGIWYMLKLIKALMETAALWAMTYYTGCLRYLYIVICRQLYIAQICQIHFKTNLSSLTQETEMY